MEGLIHGGAYFWKFTVLYMLISHLKRSLQLWLHDKSRLSKQKTIKVKWFGISLMFI